MIWTRKEITLFIIISTIPTALYSFFGWDWLLIPWLPIALVGTALAFIVGFKNNASYDRLWEARKVWGATVNSSRVWGTMAIDYVTNMNTSTTLSEEELNTIRTRLIYRHVAWLTALRHQLRQIKSWENQLETYSKEFRASYNIEEFENELSELIKDYLSKEEWAKIEPKKNRASQILKLQSQDLRKLTERGIIDNFRHVEMQNVISEFYTQQGKCERIKNFPYPRQFATINYIFVWLFIILVPFGMMDEFHELGTHMEWLTVPFSTLVAWVFHTMEKIGTATENPFEGAANDIPMTNLSRTIEIDLKEMLDEENIPAPTVAQNDILM